MNHNEAVQEMSAERYLLDDLTPDARDAFEEHMFDCPKCALDVRAGAVFMDEAKQQLPTLATEEAAPRQGAWQAGKPSRFSAWLRPLFAVPVFATLLLVVGYQNLVTLPALHSAASEPRIVSVAPLYGATRGGARATIKGDRVNGIALPVDLSTDADAGKFVSFALELDDQDGKSVWKGTAKAPAQDSGADAQMLVVIPGKLLKEGTYSMAVSGVGANGERTQVERNVFNIVF